MEKLPAAVGFVWVVFGGVVQCKLDVVKLREVIFRRPGWPQQRLAVNVSCACFVVV